MDKYAVGDIVKLKKPHPCGSSEWEIMRVGADFRLKCMGCGHQVMVPRKLVEKNDRGLTKKQAQKTKNTIRTATQQRSVAHAEVCLCPPPVRGARPDLIKNKEKCKNPLKSTTIHVIIQTRDIKFLAHNQIYEPETKRR